MTPLPIKKRASPVRRKQISVSMPSFRSGHSSSEGSFRGDYNPSPEFSQYTTPSRSSSGSSYDWQDRRQNSGSTDTTYSTDASSIWTPSQSASDSENPLYNATSNSYEAHGFEQANTGDSIFDTHRWSGNYARPQLTLQTMGFFAEPETCDSLVEKSSPEPTIAVTAIKNYHGSCDMEHQVTVLSQTAETYHLHGLPSRADFQPVISACAARPFAFEDRTFYSFLDEFLGAFARVVEDIAPLIKQLPRHFTEILDQFSAGVTAVAALTALKALQQDQSFLDRCQLFSLICLAQAGLLLDGQRSDKTLYTDALFKDFACWFARQSSTLATEALFQLVQLLWQPHENRRALLCSTKAQPTEGRLYYVAMICQSHVDIMNWVACRDLSPPLKELALRKSATDKIDSLHEVIERYLKDGLARCPQCSRTFAKNKDKSTNLSRHLLWACKITKRDPSFKKFDCPFEGCGRSYSRRDNWNDHVYNEYICRRRESDSSA